MSSNEDEGDFSSFSMTSSILTRRFWSPAMIFVAAFEATTLASMSGKPAARRPLVTSFSMTGAAGCGPASPSPNASPHQTHGETLTKLSGYTLIRQEWWFHLLPAYGISPRKTQIQFLKRFFFFPFHHFLKGISPDVPPKGKHSC